MNGGVKMEDWELKSGDEDDDDSYDDDNNDKDWD